MPNLTPVNLSHNGVTLELVPYGLTLRRLLVAGRDVLVGPEDAQELPAKGHHYRNTVIGRNTSRLPVREISVDAAGDHFTLKPEGESVALHGGVRHFFLLTA